MKLPIALDRPLVFIDLETTGLNIKSDRIVEMAIIQMNPEGDISERVRRFNPGISIPPEATAVHGIRDEDVADEHQFASVARSVAELLEGCDLAGFNIRRFDLPLLRAEFKRAGVAFDLKGRRTIDMKAIFHREEPRDLAAAARFYLDREHSDAHSALGDTRITAEVLWAQLERYDIPQSMEDLSAYCDETMPFETGLSTWFRETEQGLVFRKGKHRDSLLSKVAEEAADYLAWMLRSIDDLEDEVREALQKALDRGP